MSKEIEFKQNYSKVVETVTATEKELFDQEINELIIQYGMEKKDLKHIEFSTCCDSETESVVLRALLIFQ